MDADQSQKVSWTELYTIISQLGWADIDAKLPGAWRAIDTNINGYISLSDYNRDLTTLLIRFFNFIRDRFSTFHRFLRFLDPEAAKTLLAPKGAKKDEDAPRKE